MMNRRAWIVLLLATGLLTIANGRFSVAVFAWLAPALLLRFLRTQRPRNAFLGGLLATSIASYVWWLGIFPLHGAPYVLAAIVLGIVTLLPYLVDRVLAPRIDGILGSLVLPSATVLFDTLGGLASPFGSWGSTAYTQTGNLPLLQLLSITGLTGVTFLITWFASIVNLVWERAAMWRRGAIVYACVALAVFAFGFVRLRSPDVKNTVRIAAITPRLPTYTVRGDASNAPIHAALSAVRKRQTLTRAQWDAFRTRAAEINKELLAATEREAHEGARLVVWSEGAGVVERFDEPALIAAAADVARRTGTFIGLAFLTLDGKGAKTYENKNVFVDAAGRTVWTFRKARPVPGMEACLPGDGRIPVAPTPYGRVASLICFDMDFPRLVRQAGMARADLVLVPADDWREIAPRHSEMAAFRAVEYGFTMVRATSNGLTLAVDRFGRVQASRDYFSGARVMSANVPARGMPTLYTGIGEVVPIVAAILLGVCAVMAIRPRVQRR